jgi:nicotinamidase-related amidase
VLTGQVTEQCIVYSTLDAHIRRLPVIVPVMRSPTSHADPAEASLRMMAINMDATVCGAADIEL